TTSKASSISASVSALSRTAAAGAFFPRSKKLSPTPMHSLPAAKSFLQSSSCPPRSAAVKNTPSC
ncbi:MAG: hypothetical protein ACI4XQ_00890, partial [Eubacteriales bacterium]